MAGDYGCYDKKPYFNILLEDKAGFVPEEIPVVRTEFKKYNLQPNLPPPDNTFFDIYINRPEFSSSGHSVRHLILIDEFNKIQWFSNDVSKYIDVTYWKYKRTDYKRNFKNT